MDTGNRKKEIYSNKSDRNMHVSRISEYEQLVKSGKIIEFPGAFPANRKNNAAQNCKRSDKNEYD